MSGPPNGRARRQVVRLGRRVWPDERLRRVGASLPAIIQIVLTAVAAYSIAHFLLGHSTPILSVTVTITALGFTRDARPRRVLETVVGILVGITLSEVLLQLIGTGLWQVALVLTATFVVARFASTSPGFAAAAGTQSMLVLLLPVPDGGVFLRSTDGLVGGVLAILATALIPRDPRRAARRDAERLFVTIDDALGAVALALEHADEPSADRALSRLRKTQKIIDDWGLSLESASSIARISPFLRRHLPELRAEAVLRDGLDLSSRHLRVITRRIDFLVRDGVPRPALAALVREIRAAVRRLPAERSAARGLLEDLAARLDPAGLLPDSEMTEAVLVLLMRPLIVDLLVTTGLSAGEARALLPEV